MDSKVRDDEPTASAEVALNEIRFGFSNQLADRRKGRQNLVWSMRSFYFYLPFHFHYSFSFSLS